jgi:hypothetical protein
VWWIGETVVRRKCSGVRSVVGDEDLSWLGERSGRHVGDRVLHRVPFVATSLCNNVIPANPCFACKYIIPKTTSRRYSRALQITNHKQ